MIFSGSDWCKPCINLKQSILLTDEFAKFSGEEMVLLELDFPYKKKNKLDLPGLSPETVGEWLKN